MLFDDYILLVSVYCNKRCWSLTADVLSGYTKDQESNFNFGFVVFLNGTQNESTVCNKITDEDNHATANSNVNLVFFQVSVE